jgi:hypothetical protein
MTNDPIHMISRKRKVINFELTASADDVAVVPLVWFLEYVQKTYQTTCKIPMSFGLKAHQVLYMQQATARAFEADLGRAGFLLLQLVRNAMTRIQNPDFDDSFRILSAVHSIIPRLQKDSGSQIKIKYTLRKVRQSDTQVIMTLRSDIKTELGYEASHLVMPSLKTALSRELGKSIYVHGIPEDFLGTRTAPHFTGFGTWLSRQMFARELLELQVDEIKSNISEIKQIADCYALMAIDPAG